VTGDGENGEAGKTRRGRGSSEPASVCAEEERRDRGDSNQTSRVYRWETKENGNAEGRELMVMKEALNGVAMQIAILRGGTRYSC
jgi:hypothetical protein